MSAVDAPMLRRFGLIMGAMMVLVFGLLLPWLFGARWPSWPWLLAGALLLLAWMAPASLRLFYGAWMRVGGALGRVNNIIILGFLFYAVILPIGAFRRAWGWDPMTRQRDPKLDSYRVNVAPTSRDSLEKPF